MAVDSHSDEMDPAASSHAIEVQAMQFSYPGGESEEPVVSNLTLDVEKGGRYLLIGANGAGKTTLLRILAGKHLVGGKETVRVLGRSAFHDTSLTCDGSLGYLGGSWSRSVGCAGDIPLQGDFSAQEMIFGVADVDPSRRSSLVALLDIDLGWRMHRVSDGQRRRVQIAMGLLRPFKVLLLDEITVDLDVVARMDLLAFLKEECEVRGATVVYATHIFDGLEPWASHVLYLEGGKMRRSVEMPELMLQFREQQKGSMASEEEQQQVGGADSRDAFICALLRTVEPWLREERKAREEKEEKKKREEKECGIKKKAVSSPWGGATSRHMAYYR